MVGTALFRVTPCRGKSNLHGLPDVRVLTFERPIILPQLPTSPFPRTNVSDAGSNPCSISALASKRQLSRDHSGKATIRPGNESALKQSLRSHPWLGLPGWTCVCFAFTISRLTVIQA